MFDSGATLEGVISELENEVDIAIPISKSSYVNWSNALEHFLYTEIIKEQKEVTVEGPEDCFIAMDELSIPFNEAEVRFEDVYTVFADGVQLIKASLTSGNVFPDTFYKSGRFMGLSTRSLPETVKIIYFVKPAPKIIGEGGAVSGNIMLPIEFLELSKAKLRGEAYKIANEDAISAKWLSDYNALLETFKVWIENKRANFGM